ncbi:MAG: hypothetical protein U5K37_09450 [Natrialbaceae archaeon]|nr:hypothetical protein [Natrialbaceae archaeon]
MAVTTLGLALTGAAVSLGVGWGIYRDASSLELQRPIAWGTGVGGTVALAWSLALAVPTIPIPGLLVIAIAGPAVYMFERDDAKHGNSPADPRELPGGSNDNDDQGS